MFPAAASVSGRRGHCQQAACAGSGLAASGLAVLVIGHNRGWWRWLFLIPAIAMPALVALSRMYRGEHHPTDILGSLIFAGLWIPAVFLLFKPNAVASARAPAAVPRARWRASEAKQVPASRS